jgi:hypothetical protein
MHLQLRYFKVVAEPSGSESVPIVASFASWEAAREEADARTRASGVDYIVAYHPSSDFVPLGWTAVR